MYQRNNEEMIRGRFFIPLLDQLLTRNPNIGTVGFDTDREIACVTAAARGVRSCTEAACDGEHK